MAVAGSVKATIEAVNLTPDIIYRAAKASTLWGRLDGELSFQQLSTSDLEIIFARLQAGYTFRKLALASVKGRKLASSDIRFGSVIQVFDELVGVVDGIAFHFRKNIADGVATADAIDLIEVGKVIADNASADDVHSIAFVTGWGDDFTVDDLTSIGVEKPVSDAVSVADSRVLFLQKAVNDAIMAVDGVSFSFAQSLADALSVSDQTSIATYKTFNEVVTVVDDAFVNTGVGGSGTGANDLVGVSDTAAIGFVTQFSETVSVAEAFTLIVTLGSYPRSQLNGYPLGDWTLGD